MTPLQKTILDGNRFWNGSVLCYGGQKCSYDKSSQSSQQKHLERHASEYNGRIAQLLSNGSGRVDRSKYSWNFTEIIKYLKDVKMKCFWFIYVGCFVFCGKVLWFFLYLQFFKPFTISSELFHFFKRLFNFGKFV